MKWLPFKLTEQEKQALKEEDNFEIKKQQESALKFRPKIFLFVILPLILLLVGVVIYVLYLPVYQERNEIFDGDDSAELEAAKLEESIRVNNTDELAGETADWKIYRNEDIGFVVKYPNDWAYDYRGTIETNPNWFISFQKQDETQPKIELPGGAQEETTYNIRIYVKNNPGYFLVKDYLLRDVALESRADYETEQFTKTSVAGVEAIKMAIDSAPSSGPCTEIITLYGDLIYTFDYCATAHPETHEKFMSVFNQILSTFQFLVPKDITALPERMALEALKNMEYYLFECPTSSEKYTDEFYYLYDKEVCEFKLANGEYDFSDKITEGDHGYFVSFSNATFADLNNDKIDEALVILRTYYGGTGSSAYLAAVMVDESGYKNMDTIGIPSGGEGGVEITSIDNGIITIETFEYHDPILLKRIIMQVSFSEEKGFEIIKVPLG